MARLVPQLSSSSPPPTRERLADIVGSPACHLLLARDETGILGSMTLVVFPIPTGIRAWIEDVVVDAAARGKGVGAALNRHAIEIADRRGARTVDLTSRPTAKPPTGCTNASASSSGTPTSTGTNPGVDQLRSDRAAARPTMRRSRGSDGRMASMVRSMSSTVEPSSRDVKSVEEDEPKAGLGVTLMSVWGWFVVRCVRRGVGCSDADRLAGHLALRPGPLVDGIPVSQDARWPIRS